MMEKKKNNSRVLLAGMVAALGASLCCITPVFALIAGISGAASAFSWLDPFRPFFIVLTVSVLGFAWYQKLKPKKQNSSCECEDEPEEKSFLQSKSFLGIVTMLALFLLAFPSYSSAFFPDTIQKTATVINQAGLQQARLEISGMTCKGCESSVEHVLSGKKGVLEAKASYEKGMAVVTFNSAQTSPDLLKKAIEEEIGYTVNRLESKDIPQ